jgi:hypothetical protein
VGQGAQTAGLSGFLNVDLFALVDRPDLFTMSDPDIEVTVVAHMNKAGFVFVDIQDHVVDPRLYIFADFVIHVAVHGLFLSHPPG